ncbi:XRE family transcriptional regulator [Providencia sp. PROV032]|uniref:XRE family transcriptional regulator n=1 Tax=Providencia sp. PROV032 TaxID=2949764 RepID=UPI00234A3941|nr:XRE family transcriptional regulator [Providencia sp. PROV032]
MSEIQNIARLYKSPKSVEVINAEGNSFTDMILQTKSVATVALDKLAYLAGIKNAPADDKYYQLNTSSLSELIKSTESAGYDIEVVNI